jgi:hypothetical protein
VKVVQVTMKIGEIMDIDGIVTQLIARKKLLEESGKPGWGEYGVIIKDDNSVMFGMPYSEAQRICAAHKENGKDAFVVWQEDGATDEEFAAMIRKHLDP